MLGSIHGRLMSFILVSTALLLLVAAIVLDGLLRVQLERDFDTSLLAQAHALVTLTTQQDGEVDLDFADEYMPEYAALARPEYFELWLADGTLIERSRSLDGHDLPRLEVMLDKPGFRDISLPDGRAGRLVTVRFIPHVKDVKGEKHAGEPLAEPGATKDIQALFAVARGLEELDALMVTIRITLGAVMVALMGAISLIVRVGVASGLRPLIEIGRKVQALSANTLGTRIEATPFVEELLPITYQLNALLNRLDEAFQRERRFSGDIAHELRTPLAELRTLAEVARKWPDDRSMVEGFFADVIAVSGNMERVVANLLTLARCDAGREQVEWCPVNLEEIINETWHRVAPQALKKGMTFIPLRANDLQVNTDPAKLQLILANLFSNAVEYSPAQSEVRMSVSCEPAQVAITMTNVALNLLSEDVPRMFDRFWRKDAARTGGQHTGLGLSLAKALAGVLGLRLSARLRDNKIFEITVGGLKRV